MAREPLVSITMPFFNAERFMPEAVESVLAQTYRNWELLLVDDGSTDGSTEIALRYAEEHPDRVRYLEHDGHQNRGISASHNLAIRHGRGEYIAILDADDVWLPHNLERQVAILGSVPEAGMVYGYAQYWYSWTGEEKDANRDFIPQHGVPVDSLLEPPTLLIECVTRRAAVPCPCSILIRRKAMEAVGGFEESFRYVFTDQALYAKLLLREHVFVSSEYLARYRRHSGSSVANVKRKGELNSARLNYLTWLERYLRSQDLRGTEIWRALRGELWSYRHPHVYRAARGARYHAGEARNLLVRATWRSLPAPLRAWLKTRLRHP